MARPGRQGRTEAAVPRGLGAGRAVILIIDPDGDYLAHCLLPLLQAGYDVLIATDHQEVQCICEGFPGPIDLALLDVPFDRHARIDGRRWRDYGSQLADMVRTTRPSIKVLLTSPTPGWKLSRQRLGAVLWRFPLVSHPCSADELLNSIHALLDPISTGVRTTRSSAVCISDS